MVIMIDNYDSFTYNLVQIIETFGDEVRVFRNDRMALEDLSRLNPDRLVISPGPGTPQDSGVSVDIIRRMCPYVPVLGVCLGHQAIAWAFGGKLVRSKRIMHGKISNIFHDDKTVFRGMPNPFQATRYHSLLVERASLPACFEISAWTSRGEIMGLRHKGYRTDGVQFHPESILTEGGAHIIKTFLHHERSEQ